VKKDHEAEWKSWEKQASLVMDSLASFKGMKTEVNIPPIANHVPHVHITWDQAQIPVTPEEVTKQLREGEPSIETTPGHKDRVVVNVFMLQPGEAQIVARRLREVFKKAKA